MTLSILRGEERIEYKRQKDRERKSNYRTKLSEEEKIRMREKDRDRQAKYREKLSEEEKILMREKNREQVAKWRLKQEMDPLEEQHDTEIIIETETGEEMKVENGPIISMTKEEYKRQKARERQAKYRANLPEEEKILLREKARVRMARKTNHRARLPEEEKVMKREEKSNEEKVNPHEKRQDVSICQSEDTETTVPKSFEDKQGEYKIEDSTKLKWHRKMLKNLMLGGEASEYNDVTFVCDDDLVSAHKIILSACSPMLKSIFTDRMTEEHSFIFLPGVNHSQIKLLLDLIYFGTPTLQHYSNEFLKVADILGIQNVREENLKTISSFIDESNLLEEDNKEELDYLHEEGDEINTANGNEVQENLQEEVVEGKTMVELDGVGGNEASYKEESEDSTRMEKDCAPQLVQETVKIPKADAQHIESQDVSVKDEKKEKSFTSKQCPECGKLFYDRKTMIRHLNTIHQGLRNYNDCDQCSYRAEAKCHLKKHIESVHEGLKRFACEKCPYKTNWKSHFKSHQESKHDPTILKYNCNHCTYRAPHINHLKKHLTTHKEERLELDLD